MAEDDLFNSFRSDEIEPAYRTDLNDAAVTHRDAYLTCELHNAGGDSIACLD